MNRCSALVEAEADAAATATAAAAEGRIGACSGRRNEISRSFLPHPSPAIAVPLPLPLLHQLNQGSTIDSKVSLSLRETEFSCHS